MKVRYGSDAWIDALNETLGRLVRSRAAELGEGTFRLCEIARNVPEDLADPARGDGSRAWHIVLDGPRSHARFGAIDDPDLGIILEYEPILPIARWDYAAPDHDPAALDAYRAKLVASGAYESYGRMQSAPERFAALLSELHNEMARITA